jgi:hypothetical protein
MEALDVSMDVRPEQVPANSAVSYFLSWWNNEHLVGQHKQLNNIFEDDGDSLLHGLDDPGHVHAILSCKLGSTKETGKLSRRVEPWSSLSMRMSRTDFEIEPKI